MQGSLAVALACRLRRLPMGNSRGGGARQGTKIFKQLTNHFELLGSP